MYMMIIDSEYIDAFRFHCFDVYKSDNDENYRASLRVIRRLPRVWLVHAWLVLF